MGPTIEALHEQLPATPESVSAARHRVRCYAADLQVDLDGVLLAVSEAVSNAVAHAYAEGTRGQVELTAGASQSEFTVTVRDHGRGLAGGGSGTGAGFGLKIIRDVSEHVELTDSPGGVSLTMGFRRAG